MVLTDWANFRKAIVSWKRDLSKFLRMPKPPKYKDGYSWAFRAREDSRRSHDMLLQNLHKKKLISPPQFLLTNTMYLAVMGSNAHGVAADDADWDVYGWCIPPKEMVFPHLAGFVPGFGTQPPRFDNWLHHHIEDRETRRKYDFSVHSIVRYFNFLLNNNPNFIDTLFVAQQNIIHSTRTAEMVRENRKLFLSRACWKQFKDYSYSQMRKCRSQERTGKRAEVVERFGYDVKFASHCVRLLNEVEQILTEGDLDLMRNREQLKAIRDGEWTLQQLEDYFATKERELETAYTNSKLPVLPNENAVKALLMNVLEEHYGDLSKVVVADGREKLAILQIANIISNLGMHDGKAEADGKAV